MEDKEKKKTADEVKWIKIIVDIFDDSKIKLIRKMPEGDAIIVIWLQLLCLCGQSNSAGLLMMGKIAYTEEMLATLFDRELPIIRLALSVFANFAMIEIYDLEGQEVIAVSNWEKHQNVEGMDKIREQNRIRKAKERERKKAALAAKLAALETEQAVLPGQDDDMSRDMSRDVTGENKNIDIDKEIEDTNVSVETESPKRKVGRYQDFVDYYNLRLGDFLPKVKKLTDARRRAIKKLVAEYGADGLRVIIDKVAESDFLSGRNGKWAGATFDWIITPENALKIYEGNYDNKGSAKASKGNPFLDLLAGGDIDD